MAARHDGFVCRNYEPDEMPSGVMTPDAENRWSPDRFTDGFIRFWAVCLPGVVMAFLMAAIKTDDILIAVVCGGEAGLLFGAWWRLVEMRRRL